MIIELIIYINDIGFVHVNVSLKHIKIDQFNVARIMAIYILDIFFLHRFIEIFINLAYLKAKIFQSQRRIGISKH